MLEAARRYLVDETLQGLLPLSEEESRLAKEGDIQGLLAIHRSKGCLIERARTVDQILKNTIQALGKDPDPTEVFKTAKATPPLEVPEGEGVSKEVTEREEIVETEESEERMVGLDLSLRQLAALPNLFKLGKDRLLKYPLTDTASYEAISRVIYYDKLGGEEYSRRPYTYFQQIRKIQIAIAGKLLACQNVEPDGIPVEFYRAITAVRSQPEYSTASYPDLAMIAARGTDKSKERDLGVLPLQRSVLLERLLGLKPSPEIDSLEPLTPAENFLIWKVFQETPQEELLKFGLWISKKDREVLKGEVEKYDLSLRTQPPTQTLLESTLSKVLAIKREGKEYLLKNSEDPFAQLLLTYFGRMDSEDSIKTLFHRFAEQLGINLQG